MSAGNRRANSDTDSLSELTCRLNTGRDNPPPTSDGTCKLVGTWDSTTQVGEPISMEFDAEGNFAGGPQGEDLCENATMAGTFQLAPDQFLITQSVGMGCDWMLESYYFILFDPDCRRAIIDEDADHCIDGRTYFRGNTVLVRR